MVELVPPADLLAALPPGGEAQGHWRRREQAPRDPREQRHEPPDEPTLQQQPRGAPLVAGGTTDSQTDGSAGTSQRYYRVGYFFAP